MSIAFSTLALIVAFLIGSLPTAFILGRIKGVDIRLHGSGNVGATNAFRVLGKQWGFLCLLVDICKGFVPTYFIPYEFFGFQTLSFDGWQWCIGLMAILGHVFSPFLRFRGGKGVATSLGVLLAIQPVPVLIAFLAGLFIIWWTGYVSLASIIGALLLPLLILLYGLRLVVIPWTSVIITALLALFIVWKHRANIQRLRAGNESKIFDRFHKTQSSQDP